MSRFQCRLGKKGKLVKLVISVLDHNIMPYARGISEQASFSGFELSWAATKIGGWELSSPPDLTLLRRL